VLLYWLQFSKHAVSFIQEGCLNLKKIASNVVITERIRYIHRKNDYKRFAKV